MLRNIKNTCTFAVLYAASSSAFAHAGHDHSSNTSFLIHALWIAPTVFASYIAFLAFKNRNRKSPTKGHKNVA